MNFDQAQTWRALSDDAGNYYCQASEDERDAFRNWVKGVLRERSVTVNFHNARDEFRSMSCTLNPDLGMPVVVKENTSPRKSKDDVCVVWDLQKQSWRSFRWDRIKSVHFDLG
jgi:hypothetical protein